MPLTVLVDREGRIAISYAGVVAPLGGWRTVLDIFDLPGGRSFAIFEGAEGLGKVARPEGLEPPTLCLEGRRSIRLSYGRADYRSHSKPLLDFVSRNLNLAAPHLRQNLENSLLR
jgi:hypothetical protein